MNNKRVGTLTLGFVLSGIGGLFLAKLFGVPLSYRVIAACWPIIFILLGTEILIGARKSKTEPLRYDAAAIVLTILLSFFAMAMAGVQYILEYHLFYFIN